jgi:diketogulonate reductase-like aldo/keto reductase
MAYSPVAQGNLLTHRKVTAIAREAMLAPAQLALAWILTRSQVIAIPQSSSLAHIDEIRGAAAIRLEPGILAALDAAFPPPQRDTPLSVI